MIKIAVYGKGGIGKSTTVSNVAAAFAEQGLKVMQIGCDPKADSTLQLRHGEEVPTVLDLYNQKKNNFQLEDMVRIGYNGVICVEAGGPTPGLGCAGRGIITALEKLKEKGAYETYQPDIVLYDVLGDVVCGGGRYRSEKNCPCGDCRNLADDHFSIHRLFFNRFFNKIVFAKIPGL